MFSKGEKVHVITRRLFDSDLRRHFIGEIQEVSGAAIRVRGYAFVFDENNKEFVRRDEIRTRIISTIDAGFIINVFPNDVIIENLRYKLDENNHRVITDGNTFSMDMSEFGVHR